LGAEAFGVSMLALLLTRILLIIGKIMWVGASETVSKLGTILGVGVGIGVEKD
jgi:hypothetical protein